MCALLDLKTGHMTGKKDISGTVPPKPSVMLDDAATRASQGWWADFKATVEDPDASVYDFLKNNLREKLELEGEEGFVDVLSKAQRKAVREALELTQPKELRDALKNLEKNRLFFDYRGRVILKLFRVVMDTYIVALHGEAKHAPLGQDEAVALHGQVEALIEEQLGNADVLTKVENLAGELTHLEQEEIKKTVEEAAKQLKEKSTLSRIADDALALGKTFLKPDTLAGFAINSLPLITWQYRGALALGLGAFACRRAVYHAAIGAFSLVKGDVQGAKAEGGKALTAMKAAGGNVLTVGLSPAFAKLPRAIMSFGPFMADYVYNKALDIGHALLQKKENQPDIPLRTRLKNGVKSFFSDNQDTLANLSIKTLKVQVPHKLTQSFAKASKRVKLSTVRSVSKDVYHIGKILLKRNFNAAASYFHPQVIAKPEISEALENAVTEAVNDNDKELSNAFGNVVNADGNAQRNHEQIEKITPQVAACAEAPTPKKLEM
jgi:hypothetical protein